MIVLDTCILIFDALTPERLSPAARAAIEDGERNRHLACAGISLWEIAMLITKGRLAVGIGAQAFLQDVLAARTIRVQPITAEIATLSATHPAFSHGDPADRLIAATALALRCPLVTSDDRLRSVAGLNTIW